MPAEIPGPQPSSLTEQGVLSPGGKSLDISTQRLPVVHKEGNVPTENSSAFLSVEHLKLIADHGNVLADDPRHVGRHGTSLEAMIYTIRTGSVSGVSSLISERYAKGDLSFYPTPAITGVSQHVPESVINFLTANPKRIERDLRGYAQSNAQEHAIMRAFGYPLDHDEAAEGAYWASDEAGSDYDFFQAEGASDDEIEAVAAVSKARKGFILGISADVVRQEFPIVESDPGMGDLRIRTGEEGLPYKFLSGIEPLGPVEERFLHEIFSSDNLENTLTIWESTSNLIR